MHVFVNQVRIVNPLICMVYMSCNILCVTGRQTCWLLDKSLLLIYGELLLVVCMLLACCYDKLTTNVLCFSHDDSSSPISYYPLHGFRSSTHFPSVYPWLRNIDGKHSSRKSLLCADGVEVEAAYTFANPSDIVMFFYLVSARRKVIDRQPILGPKNIIVYLLFARSLWPSQTPYKASAIYPILSSYITPP